MTLPRPIRIAMWSGPRNISTAMMRSFGSRGDCAVTDEPFYGAFLKETGEPQPMAEQIIAAMDCDWQNIAQTMHGPVPDGKQVWYQKHMPHHMVSSISIRDFPDHRHAFLIRAPERVVASYAAKRVSVTPADLGYERQLEYVEQAAELTGKPPIVLDSADILSDPGYYLQKLCVALEISWDPAMLGWSKGRRSTDGIWGEHWYNRVIETTEFGSNKGILPPLDIRQQKTVEICTRYYDKLSQYSLK